MCAAGQIESRRNGSIEVFRCLMMFMVVWTHAKNYWSSDLWWHDVLSACLCWQVDGFLSISGWFGIRFSWKKFLSLFSLMIFYRVFDVSYCLMYGKPLTAWLNWGWFGRTYLVLLMMSGFLNAAVDSLFVQSRRMLYATWLLTAIGLGITWAPMNLMFPVCAEGVVSRSIVTMVFVYLTARTARKLFSHRICFARLFTCLLCCVFAYSVLVCLGWLKGLGWSAFVYKIENFSPVVYIWALCSFLIFFWHVRFPKFVEDSAVFLAPTLFGVYWVHSATQFGRDFFAILSREIYDLAGGGGGNGPLLGYSLVQRLFSFAVWHLTL